MDSHNSASQAPRGSFAQSSMRAHGCRRVTLDMRAWLDRADSFKGLPHGTAKPLTFLYAFKEAAPYLGLPNDAYKLVDWLMSKYCKNPQDWEEGSRPIAWPQLRYQAEFLGLSERRTQALNRTLQEAGIFVMRDDPQGRRYGHRDPKTGRITKAFGFDLSLLKERHDEFKKIAVEAQIERDRMKNLRQQKTLARKAIAQAAEELAVQGHDSEELQRLLQEAADLVKAGSQCRRSDELALAVKALERRKDEVQGMLAELVKPVETAPMGAENDTHSTTTTLRVNNLNYSVIAAKGCSGTSEPSSPQSPTPGPGQASQATSVKPAAPRTDRGMVHAISANELVQLAPKLKPYLRRPDPTWPEIVDAADWLGSELGISKSAWSEACVAMGRDVAAIAIALITTKEPGEIKNPGGYFRGMLAKHIAGELHLERTVWALRRSLDPSRYNERPRFSRSAGQHGQEA
jgi:replication initiation protein RepC